MPKNTNPPKNNEKSEDPVALEPSEVSEPEATDEGDSSSADDASVLIEAEAVEPEDAPEGSSEDNETNREQPDEQATEDAPEVLVTAIAPPPPEPARAGSSVFALGLGGLIAGAIGYLAATVAAPPPIPPTDTTELSESLAATNQKLESLTTDLADLRATSPEDASQPVTADLSGVETEIAALVTRIGDIETSLSDGAAALEARIAKLEAMPAGPEGAGLSTDEEIAAFRAQLDEITAEASARVEEAQARAAEIESAAAEAAAAAERTAAEAQAAAERQAVLVDLKAALENGAGFAPVLDRLDADIPPPLANAADKGVVTMAELQKDFPSAARAALAAAVTVPQDASTGERLGAFLKRQTIARSLSPKEGDDADAVLSRAEARLSEGDLPMALAELDALPEAAKSAMDGWLARANARTAAFDAVSQLSATN